MSDVVWCDYGGHLMSANDPDREFWTKQGNEYGQNQRQMRIDTCAKHRTPTISFPELPAMADLNKRVAALESSPDTYYQKEEGNNDE